MCFFLFRYITAIVFHLYSFQQYLNNAIKNMLPAAPTPKRMSVMMKFCMSNLTASLKKMMR